MAGSTSLYGGSTCTCSDNDFLMTLLTVFHVVYLEKSIIEQFSIALFTVSFFSFALQCNLTWVRGNFGLKLQNSPKLPPIHATLYCNANEKN